MGFSTQGLEVDREVSSACGVQTDCCMPPGKAIETPTGMKIFERERVGRTPFFDVTLIAGTYETAPLNDTVIIGCQDCICSIWRLFKLTGNYERLSSVSGHCPKSRVSPVDDEFAPVCKLQLRSEAPSFRSCSCWCCP